MVGILIWIPKFSVQSPLVFEVPQVPVIQDFQDYFVHFLTQS